MGGNRALRRPLALVVVALAVTALAAPSAQADGAILSDPLSIFSTDDGRMQVNFGGAPFDEFGVEEDGRLPRLGLMVQGQLGVFGFAGSNDYQFRDRQIEHHSESTEMRSIFEGPVGNPILRVVEEVSYSPGANRHFSVDYTFENLHPSLSITLTPKILGDAAPGGDTFGTANFVEPSVDERAIRMRSSDGSALLQVEERTSWAAYEGNDYQTLADKVTAEPPEDFGNFVYSGAHDTGFGTQWNEITLGPGETWDDTIGIDYSFLRRLDLGRARVARQLGEEYDVQGIFQDEDGNGTQSGDLRYFVTGPNPQDDQLAETDEFGNLLIESWTGEGRGTDDLVVYEDADGEQDFDDGEIHTRVRIDWLRPAAGTLAEGIFGDSFWTGARYQEGSPGSPEGGPPAAQESQAVAGFPRTSGEWTLLTTGAAEQAFNSGGSTSTDARGFSRYAHDPTVLAIDFDVDEQSCVKFDLRFLTTEDPDSQNPYNDTFIAELDRTSWWVAPDGTIEAPDNFARDQQGRPMSVSSLGETAMFSEYARGTNYTWGTEVLTVRTPVAAGNHTLYLSVFDVGDADFDSAAMVDNGVVTAVPADECPEGVFAADPARSVDLDPEDADVTVGDQHPVDYQARDGEGNPREDLLLRYFVEGANPVSSSALPQNDSGAGALTFTGEAAGEDEFVVYRDGNGNDQMDAGEELGRASMTWSNAATSVELTPLDAERTVGEEHTVAFEAFDGNGDQYQDPALRYFVDGANPVDDSVLPQNSAGAGEVSWTGGAAGEDTLVVYRDANGNETIDEGEGLNEASVTWTDPAPPPTAPRETGPPPPPTQELRLALTPAEGSSLTGTSHSVEATATIETPGVPKTALARTDPLPGRSLRYSIAGPNPSSGAVTSGGDGKAAITWTGPAAGIDTLTVFVDADSDGSRGAGEPQATATVEWLDPPIVNRTANVEPVAGEVLIRLPAGANARKLGLAGATQRFVPITEATEIPLGSTIETAKGRVRLQTAIGLSQPGKTQNGEFYQGRFQLTQKGGSRRPVTELAMNAPLSCRSGSSSKVTTAGSRSRRLWGNARGRFRTRGRRSTATVRGTTWLTKDTCATTTTRVRSGVVIVRDFAKRRNITVRRGRQYVARARRSR